MITEYYRPESLAEAIDLNARTDSVVIGGGTVVNAQPTDVAAVIDLQALGLSGIERDGDHLRIGATTTLKAISDGPAVPTTLRDLARRELPSGLRERATLGGTIAAGDAESELLTALLAFGAILEIVDRDGTRSVDIPSFFAAPTGIIVAVDIPGTGTAATERTGRTPMDRPIVCAVSHRAPDGTVRLALGGVSDTPVTVDPAGIDDLEPPGDFRGSSAFRKHLAKVLAKRVIAAVGATP